MSFAEDLRARARARPCRVVLAEGSDPRVAEAAATLRAEGIAEPIVLGPGRVEPARDPRLPAETLSALAQAAGPVGAVEHGVLPVNYACPNLIAIGPATTSIGFPESRE